MADRKPIPWPRIAAGAAILWGALAILAAGLHTGASIATAFRERGGADQRLATMGAIGWAMLAAGASLAWCGWRMWTAGTHHRVALALAVFTVGWTGLLVAVSPVGFAGSVALLGLLWAGRPR